MPISVNGPRAPVVSAPSRDAANPTSPATLQSLPAAWHPTNGTKAAESWKGATFQAAAWAKPTGSPDRALYTAVEQVPGVRGTTAIGNTLAVTIDQVDDTPESRSKAVGVMEAVLEATSDSPNTNVVFQGHKEAALGTFDPATSMTARVGELGKASYAAVMLKDELKGLPGFKDVGFMGALNSPEGHIGPKVVVTVAPNTSDAAKLKIAETARASYPFADLVFAQKPVSTGWTPK